MNEPGDGVPESAPAPLVVRALHIVEDTINLEDRGSVLGVRVSNNRRTEGFVYVNLSPDAVRAIRDYCTGWLASREPSES
jgi:hypothetical protein